MRRIVAAIGLAAGAGWAWLAGGTSLLGPAASIALPIAAALATDRKSRFAAAAAYYLIGSSPIVGAVRGYWGPGHDLAGIGAWLAASAALAAPWALASSAIGVVFAILATALPPLGVIGWLSPLNAAGVLFPGTRLVGVILLIGLLAAVAAVVSRRPLAPPVRHRLHAGIAGSAALSILLVAFAPTLQVPPGWAGVSTAVLPARGNMITEIRNNNAIIRSITGQAPNAGVVAAPESVVDGWFPGTQQQFSHAVPAGQTWILGVQADSKDAVYIVRPGKPPAKPVALAAGLLLGGDWIPSRAGSLTPAWWQRVFSINGKRVWAALCIEQVQPWTWMEAAIQRADVVLAMTNSWWATTGNRAPDIQAASTRAWARLLGAPVILAENRSPSVSVAPRRGWSWGAGSMDEATCCRGLVLRLLKQTIPVS